MVLISIILLFVQTTDSTLTSRYKEQLRETVLSTLEVNDFELKAASFSRGELHEIFSAGEMRGYVMLAEVKACKLGGCSAYEKVETNGASEYFDMLIVIDKNSTILKVQILDYFSDFGYEVTSKSYLKKYRGKNICDFLYDTDDVDIVSGATISCYALEGMISLLCAQISEDHKDPKALQN